MYLASVSRISRVSIPQPVPKVRHTEVTHGKGINPMNTSETTRKNKSGSNNRQRQLLLGSRVTAEEMARIQAAAEREGQTVATFIRSLALRNA